MANFLDFESKLIPMLETGTLDEIGNFVKAKSFSTRIKHLVKMADLNVTAANILTQIDKMEKVRKDAREVYDHLCEHTHPNAMGLMVFFTREDRATETTYFSEEGFDPNEQLTWILVGADVLSHLEDALDNIEKRLAALSERGAKERPKAAP